MANDHCPRIPTVTTSKRYGTGLLACRLVMLCALCLLAGFSVQAQWLTQSVTLKPGWNAIYLHVDASHQSLDDFIPDANSPVAEIWLWRPKFSTIQFLESPSSPTGTDSRWAVWTSARGDTDTLQRLVANGAYLVRNKTAADFTLQIKGRPAPPAYQWTTAGLNFIGFPTPVNTAPSFTAFLTPAPGLDLSKSLQNSARVFRYGVASGEATSTPSEVVSLIAGTTLVKRGEAFWVRGSTNYYNHYYGPVEVSLQNEAGIHFRDTLGTYSLRLKNRTSSPRTVTLSQLSSEAPPAGQTSITAPPQLLVRGALSTTTLTYSHTVLSGHSVTLAPEGEAGSEQEVVLGLNRSSMTAAPGALYAAILRITDSVELQQVDLPVSATVPDASGLWVGLATVERVGQYLKQFPKVSATNSIAAAVAQAGRPAINTEIPGAVWVPRNASAGTLAYETVACSLSGQIAVAGTSGPNGRLYVTTDEGVSWMASGPFAPFMSVACSGDGSLMAAAARQNKIQISTNFGVNWIERDAERNWVGIACSADGRKLAAVVQGGKIYLSSNGGVDWTEQATFRNWSSIAMSHDGTKLIAGVNPGQLFISSDSGKTWIARADSRNWSAVASSKDGTRLIACVDNAPSGGVFVSTNSGVVWQPTTLGPRRWQGVAIAMGGQRMAAVSKEGGDQHVQLSDDGGVTWTGQSLQGSFTSIAMPADGTRVVAVGDLSNIFTLSRQFAQYDLDESTGLIRDQDGRYLSSGINTNLARVPSPVPLRLILHNNAPASRVSLLQRVFIGKAAGITNMVVATQERALDAAELASARRISAPHLPFSMTNTFWSANANFNPGSVLTLDLPVDYNDHASNPFLHTFHPDHDNLDPKFQKVRAQGEESYSITRRVRLTFTSGGTDFRSLTASAQGRSGSYEETVTLGGKAGAIREFRVAGTFSLQRISPIATLTTQ
jgi:hypothetical protein